MNRADRDEPGYDPFFPANAIDLENFARVDSVDSGEAMGELLPGSCPEFLAESAPEVEPVEPEDQIADRWTRSLAVNVIAALIFLGIALIYLYHVVTTSDVRINRMIYQQSREGRFNVPYRRPLKLDPDPKE